MSAQEQVNLSGLLGRPVRDPEGHLVGHVVDVSVDDVAAEPVLDRVMVGRRGQPVVELAWSQIGPGGGVGRGSGWSVRPGSPGAEAIVADVSTNATAAAPRLWLRRDVLDSQVIDLAGNRLSRVSEVFLVFGGDRAPTVVGVDLGTRSLLRRMGLGRIGRRMSELTVDWDDIYLASPGGHRFELSVSPERLRRLDARVVAEVVARLHTTQASEVLLTVDRRHAVSALAASHHLLRGRLLRALPSHEAAALIAGGSDGLAGEPTPSLLLAAHAGRRFRRTVGWRVRRPTVTRR